MKFSLESLGKHNYAILSSSGRCIRPSNGSDSSLIVGGDCIINVTSLRDRNLAHWRIENVSS